MLYSVQAELRNLLSELQNRTVSAFTSRRYDEQNILRDEYQEAILDWHNKQIEEAMAKFSLKKDVRYGVKATDSVIVITPANKLKEVK